MRLHLHCIRCGCERAHLSTGKGLSMGVDLFFVAGVVLCAFGMWWWGLALIGLALFVAWPR